MKKKNVRIIFSLKHEQKVIEKREKEREKHVFKI